MILGSNGQLQQELEYTLLKTNCHSWWFSKMQSDSLEVRYAIKFCLNLDKIPLKRMECFRLLLDYIAWIEHQFLSGKRNSRKAGRQSVWDDERCGRSKEVYTPELIGQRVRVRVRVTMLRFKGSLGRDSVGRDQHSLNRFSGNSPGQFTSSQPHPCHILFDQDGHQDSSSASL